MAISAFAPGNTAVTLSEQLTFEGSEPGLKGSALGFIAMLAKVSALGSMGWQVKQTIQLGKQAEMSRVARRMAKR